MTPSASRNPGSGWFSEYSQFRAGLASIGVRDDSCSNGATEAINGRLEALRRNGLGFRNLINHRLRSLLHCGALALQIRKSPLTSSACCPTASYHADLGMPVRRE